MEEWHIFTNDKTVPVIIANELGIITYVNALFEQTFSWQSAELLGQPIGTIIPVNLRDAHNMGFSRYRISGESKILHTPLDLEILTGTGDVKTAHHYIISKRENATTLFAAKIVLRDED